MAMSGSAIEPPLPSLVVFWAGSRREELRRRWPLLSSAGALRAACDAEEVDVGLSGVGVEMARMAQVDAD